MTQQFHDHALSPEALAQLFTEARSYNGWLGKPVSDEQLHAIWDLMKMAPTSANMQPARIVWVKSAEAKAKLADCVMEGNRAKVLAAPVTAVIVIRTVRESTSSSPSAQSRIRCMSQTRSPVAVRPAARQCIT
jgi:nitroreductase